MNPGDCEGHVTWANRRQTSHLTCCTIRLRLSRHLQQQLHLPTLPADLHSQPPSTHSLRWSHPGQSLLAWWPNLAMLPTTRGSRSSHVLLAQVSASSQERIQEVDFLNVREPRVFNIQKLFEFQKIHCKFHIHRGTSPCPPLCPPLPLAKPPPIYQFALHIRHHRRKTKGLQNSKPVVKNLCADHSFDGGLKNN